MSSPTADVSVRVAWSDDAPAIAEAQASSWREQYPTVFPLGSLPGLDELTGAWHASLQRSDDARNRVLIALERNRVCGFAVTTPAADPDCDPIRDGEIAELVVSPGEERKGHGSRLLQAAADTLVADKFERAVTWVLAGDDVRRAFLTGAGWAPDAAHRELDLDGTGAHLAKQVRLHTALA